MRFVGFLRGGLVIPLIFPKGIFLAACHVKNAFKNNLDVEKKTPRNSE